MLILNFGAVQPQTHHVSPKHRVHLSSLWHVLAWTVSSSYFCCFTEVFYWAAVVITNSRHFRDKRCLNSPKTSPLVSSFGFLVSPCILGRRDYDTRKRCKWRKHGCNIRELGWTHEGHHGILYFEAHFSILHLFFICLIQQYAPPLPSTDSHTSLCFDVRSSFPGDVPVLTDFLGDSSTGLKDVGCFVCINFGNLSLNFLFLFIICSSERCHLRSVD